MPEFWKWQPRLWGLQQNIIAEQNRVRELGRYGEGEYEEPTEEEPPPEPTGAITWAEIRGETEPTEAPPEEPREPRGWPWEWLGVTAWEYQKYVEQQKQPGQLTLEELRAMSPPSFPRRPWGKRIEEYRELPFVEQMGYELPFWYATAFAPSATFLRARLAPAAARPGLPAVLPEVARVALFPVEWGIERPIAVALKYGIGFPLKYGVAKPIELTVRKSFEKVLDGGLDYWLTLQGVRGTQANRVIRFFLEKNNRWLYLKAQANLDKRIAEKKGIKWATKKAAQDTVKEAEPMLLKAAATAGVTTKPAVAVKLPVPPEVTRLKAFRGERPIAEGRLYATDAGDLGAGVYYTDYESFARTYGVGGKVKVAQLEFKNPLRLSSGEAVKLSNKYKTVTGTEAERIAGARQMRKDLLSKGYDGLIVEGYETPKGYHTIVDLRPTPPEVAIPKAEVPIIEPMATNTQKVEAHRIAYGKALISEAGKMKPQYRRLAKAMTGKGSMLEMTEAEADFFTEALRRLPEATIKGRVKIPPSIPIITKVTPENYFNIQFGEPTPIKYFTSQTYYAQKLGVKPLVEPLELAKQRLDLEFPAWEKAVDLKINEINKIWGVGLKEQLEAKVKNIPTRAVVELRDLLNKYETLPAELVDKMPMEQVKLFSWFRNLNRTIINGENQVRRLLDIEEIPYREAYVRHVPDAMAQEILLGNRPLPEELKYWATRIVGKRIFNPMEMQRQLSDDLAKYFTRDLAYASKSMIWTGLKEIHLSRPLQSFSEQMGAFTKDLKEWKHLYPAEFERFQKINVLPASTRRWVTDYVNQVIKGQQTFFDEEINRIMTRTGFAGLMNQVLKPFGRTLGIRPITNLATLAGRLTILSVMTPRPGLVKMIIRNLFQHTQDMALYGIKNVVRGYYPARGLQAKIIEESLFFKGYTGFEQLPTAMQGKIEKMALWPYGHSAIFNARTAMKTASWQSMDLIQKPKYKQFNWADPQRTGREAKDFVYPSEEALLRLEMEFGARATQYQYIAMGMPQIFRVKALLPFTRLQSWWMNHFFMFHREAMHRAFYGEASYARNFERQYGRRPKLPWGVRTNYLKYLILGGAILTGMGYTTSYLLGVLPYNLAPAGQFAMGIWRYTAADTDWQRAEAKRQIFNSWRAIVPGALATKELEDIWTGKKPLWSIFFYGKEEEGPPPHTPTWGIVPTEEKGEEPWRW